MPVEQPLMRALAGARVDPPPIWIMRQAGRYLPEYRAVRDKAGDFLSLCFTPELAAEVTLQPIRRFGFDAAIIFADILLVPYALGSELRFETGTGPILSRIESRSDVQSLRRAGSIGETLAPVSEALRLVRQELPRETTLLGFAGSPWTVATYMIAGRGTLNQAPALFFMRKHSAVFSELIDRITEATIVYLSEQIGAGAEAIKLFDTWCGVLEGDEFQKYSIEPTTRIVNDLKKIHPDVPIIAFPRKAGRRLPLYAKSVAADCIAIDSSMPSRHAHELLPPSLCVQGNLDPALLATDDPELTTRTLEILENFADRPHIFNLGHGITPDAKVERVDQLLEVLRSG